MPRNFSGEFARFAYNLHYYIMFRDSRNPGSNQKFLLLVVFLEGFHPYFRLVPVQNNFRLELSLFQVIYLIKGTSLLKQ